MEESLIPKNFPNIKTWKNDLIANYRQEGHFSSFEKVQKPKLQKSLGQKMMIATVSEKGPRKSWILFSRVSPC